ncbi:hypothetical protein ACGFT2_15395 [Streptomyces sp. NPDC048514]|uniref:hypothetical protein n=1 Tax=Streptomyces sp. NPDC048514 TaxID=3365564 RepID=UPI00371558AD
MSGRTNSGTDPEIAEAQDGEAQGEDAQDGEAQDGEAQDGEAQGEDAQGEEAQDGEARRARWTAAGAGGLLSLAGLAAALLRLTGSAPVLVPAAYALGAAVCALAALLGFRGRTRRALWLLIAGTMIMALGDQFD